jgi:hypothetical protein
MQTSCLLPSHPKITSEGERGRGGDREMGRWGDREEWNYEKQIEKI